MLEENIDKISQILGDDILTMEEKENLLKTIEEVNNDKIVIQEWIMEENARLKYEGQMTYAREEGREQGKIEGKEEGKLELIKNMLRRGDGYKSISEITNKSIEEIEEIANSIEK